MKKIKVFSSLLCVTSLLSSCSILDDILGSNSSQNTSSSTNTEQSDGLVLIDINGEIKNDDIIEVETYYDYYFLATINNEEAIIDSIIADNEDVIITHTKSLYPRKEGESKITITCKTKSSSKEYVRTFTVKSVYHGDIESIYVTSGDKGITIDEDNNINFNGKVYLKYQNGKTKNVTKDNNLIAVVENENENTKEVKISYTQNDKTVETKYNVSLENKGISKTILKQGYNTYCEYGYYNIYGHVPTTGDVNILAVPVWFTDSANYINESLVDLDGKNQKEQIIEDLNEALFGDPIRKDDVSLKSYYEDESFGTLTINGKVTEWFNSSYSSSLDYYANKDYRNGITKEVIDWYKSTYPEDETKYDCVLLLYGSNIYGEQMNYTGFATKLSEEYKGYSDYIWASALSIYDINQYSEDFKEMGDLSDNVSNDSFYQQTIIHEFAHTMGVSDLYSNSSRLTGGKAVYPVGGYSMQTTDQGGHDAYSMLALNWANPYVLSADTDYNEDSIEITINDLHSSGDAIILTPHWNENDSPFDEYILLELYAQTGINKTFNPSTKIEPGIRVYHVDSRLFDLKNYEFTTDATVAKTVIPFSNTAGRSNGPYTLYPVLNNYNEYDLVHLIRKLSVDSKGNEVSYYTTDWGRENMWFTKGDTFKMSDFANQFKEYGTFDDGESTCGWTFEVINIETDENGGASATIRFTKE